jgi:hypothetical protein
MNTHLAKIRRLQEQLQNCKSIIQDTSKKQRLESILLELYELEQNMLFKDVLHIQPIKNPHDILNDFDTNFRVRADMNPNIPITTPSEQEIMKNLQIQKQSAEIIGFSNHLLPAIIDTNMQINDIEIMVNNDNSIPNHLKEKVFQDILKRLDDYS